MSQSFKITSIAVRRTVFLLALLLLTGCESAEQRAQSYYEQGKQYLVKQDYVKAGVEFRNAVQLKKNLVEAWRGLAEVELHNRNFQGAVAILRTVVDLDPKDLDARLKLGHFLMAGNAVEQALEMADAAIALDGRNPKALAFRAAVRLMLKDNVGAKRDSQAALDIDPSNAEALIVTAAEQAASGDAKGALAILERPGPALNKDDNLAIQIFKLRLLEQSGDLKQMEIVLRKLTDLYPQEGMFRQAILKLYIRQKRFDDAEKELRSIAAANPLNVEDGLNVVRFLMQFKGPQVARQELLSRISAGSDVFRYQLALADFDFSHGNVADSVRQLESLVKDARSREDILAAQIKLAQIQFQLKKFDAADALVTSILRKDGRNSDGLKLRASLRLEKGQTDAAIADLRQALDDQPRSSDIMLLMAQAYERGGSIELAEKEYADAIKVSNLDPTVGLNYVAFLRRRGSNDRAEEMLGNLAQRSPSNVAVLSTLAELRLARQNWTGAQQIADKIRQLDNAGSLSDQIQAAALSGEGKYNDSIKILEGLQASSPAAVAPTAALVSAMVRAQKFDEAVNFLQTVLKSDPANAEAYVLLGSVQLVKKEPDAATASFKAAITQQPKQATGYVALVNFYMREKNAAEAEKVVRAGLQQLPGNFAIHMALAGVLELKGDYDAAISEYEELLKQQPGSMIIANNLASLIADHHTDKASVERAYALAGVLRKSQIPSFKDTLGWLEYLRGDYKNATALVEQAAAALPERALVQYHLGMIYVATGQSGKAADQFKKALALSPDADLQEKISAAQKKAAL